MALNIGSLPVTEKLDRINYDIWSLKVQFLLNSRNIVEYFTTTMSTPANSGEDGKDIIASAKN